MTFPVLVVTYSEKPVVKTQQGTVSGALREKFVVQERKQTTGQKEYRTGRLGRLWK